MAFPPHLLDEIRGRLDIVELVGQAVNLRRAGDSWKGLCPFHAEKTPSFTVNPKKGIFYCFGCHAGGDAFGFLMRQERLTFPDAVRLLAQRTGVELPSAPRERPEAEGRLDALRRIMATAAEFYAERLWARDGTRARSYLERRGIDPDVARRFGLGHAPEGWDVLLGFMRGRGVAEDALAQAGLVVPRHTGGGFYDRFRGRLLFPIRDAHGQVVAFGGRAMGTEEPKYLNSPETSLYSKGQMLYALDLARAGMKERGRAVVVEGYVDCLMAHQHGFTEAVAALGTAFTTAQLALLRRHADEVIAVFDADAAGQRATERIEEMMGQAVDIQGLGWSVARTGSYRQAEYFPVKVAVLPTGHDPDSLLRSEGATAFQSRLDAARSIFGCVMDRALAEGDLATDRGRATAHARAALILSKVPNAEEASSLGRWAARELGVDATQLWIEAQALRAERAKVPSRPDAPSAPAALRRDWPEPALAERDLLLLLLHMEELRERMLSCIEDEDVLHPGLRAVLGALRKNPAATASALMADLPGDAERGLVAGLLLEERSWAQAEVELYQFQRRYEMRRRRRQLKTGIQAIARAQAAGDPAMSRLEGELEGLKREARAIRELLLPGSASGPGQPANH
jgi:DNA primase